MIRRWAWVRCRHGETYRERRQLAGTDLWVLHFVCHYCGHAAPIMHRTPEEHARIVTQHAVTERTITMTPSPPTRPELEPDPDDKPELEPAEPEDEPKPPAKPTPPAPVPKPEPARTA